MLNQVSLSQINVGKLDVVPTEDSSSFNIELSPIYNQVKIEMNENMNNNNINSKIFASPESFLLTSKISPNRLTKINRTVDNSPIRPSTLIYSNKSGNNSDVSIQTGKVSSISANGIIPKSKQTSQMNKKTIITSSTSDLSTEIESNEPILTKISKDAYSTFLFQTLDSNVNSFVASAPISRICGKTKKLDHILELACIIMGDEDIKYQESYGDINSSVDLSTEYKTNKAFKIHLPPQEEDKKKMLEDLVMRMFNNSDDAILEKEIKESKMTDGTANKVKSLTKLSLRHRTENNNQLIEEGQNENENGLHQLDSKDNSKYTDTIENNIENKEEFANQNSDYFTSNDLKKIDSQSIVEFDEQEMLKYLNISKDTFSDRNTFDNNVSDDEISDEDCVIKYSNEVIKQHSKHSQWYRRLRNYFHGEGLKIKN